MTLRSSGMASCLHDGRAEMRRRPALRRLDTSVALSARRLGLDSVMVSIRTGATARAPARNGQDQSWLRLPADQRNILRAAGRFSDATFATRLSVSCARS